MEKVIIKKNRHRPTPFRVAAFHPIFLFNKQHFDKEFVQCVMFGNNCKYNIDVDQSDYNKLTGVCLGITGPHGTSYRFAWRYCEKLNMIEICAYYYCNGKGWTAEHLAYVHLLQDYRLSLKIKARDGRLAVVFSIKDICSEKEEHQIAINHILNHSPRLGFGCGLYFGGNRRAPHTMTFLMSKMEVYEKS